MSDDDVVKNIGGRSMKTKQTKFALRNIIPVVLVCLSIVLLITACNKKPQSKDKTDDSVFGEWIVEKEAECETDGLKYRTNGKGERQEEVIEALGHDYGDWTVDKSASYLEEGLKTSVCKRCHNRIEQPISVLVDGTYGLEYAYLEKSDSYYVTGAGEAKDVKDLIIPTSYKGKSVVYVYKNSFISLPNLETVKFYDNTNYTYIYSDAFQNCQKLRSIEIPSSVAYLPDDFAEGCNALTEFKVSADSEYFASVDGVIYTKDLKSLVAFPEGKAGVYTVPQTLTKISYYNRFISETNYPLAYAKNISEYAVDGGNTQFAIDTNGILFSADMRQLLAYPHGNTSPTLSLDSETLSSIGSKAFANNTHLKNVRISSTKSFSLADYAFYNTAIQKLELSGAYSFDQSIYGNPELQEIKLFAGNTSNVLLSFYAMADNKELKSVQLPHNLDADSKHGSIIYYDPFWNDVKLENITIEEGESAFVSQDGAVYSKDKETLLFFAHARKDLTLPNNLKAINSTALKYNTSLKFDVVDGCKYYKNWLVAVEDDELKTIAVKDGTVGIAAYALANMSLDKLKLPSSVKYLSVGALNKNTSKIFEYNADFDYVGNNCFYNFTYSGDVFDLGTPSYLGSGALQYAKVNVIKIGYLNNGNSVDIDGKYGKGAFSNSTAHTLMFGPYVTSVTGSNACKNMKNLTDVYIASQSLIDDTGCLYNGYTHNGSVTKNKYIATNLVMSENAEKAMQNLMNNFIKKEGETVTVDGLQYQKYSRN